MNFVIRMFCFCLQTFYAEKFGAGIVDIVKDSNVVECDKLDPNKVSRTSRINKLM